MRVEHHGGAPHVGARLARLAPSPDVLRGKGRDFNMSRVRIHNMAVSLDGFATGADQSPKAPFGHAGHRLLQWFTSTRSFRVMQGQEGGTTGIDDAFASKWGPGIGAEIMGRNK